MQKFDYIILGGGISGLTFARLLQQHTKKSFVVIEKESVCGGLCRSANVNGNYLDIGGGHFLYSKHQEVYDFIFSHVAQSEFMKHERITKIKMYGGYIDYPIEQNIWQLKPAKQLEYVMSLINAPRGESYSFRQHILSRLGASICNDYMIPYNEKLWGIGLEDMSTEWLYKLPAIELEAIIRSLIYKEADRSKLPSHDYFYYPIRGGFDIIPNSIYDKIKDHVLLMTEVKSVTKDYGDWSVNGIYRAPVVVNTIPWTSLPDSFDHPVVSALRACGLVVSFCEDPEFYMTNNFNGYNWCYHPEPADPFHRSFMVNTYAKCNSSLIMAYESNLTRGLPELDNCILQQQIPYAYPIPTINLNNQMMTILSYYASQSLYGLGRWGRWKHHNSDICIYEAMNLFERLENITIAN